MTKSNLFLNLFRSKEGTSYTAGQTIITSGTKGETMFIVEMALIDDDPRSATVVAKTDCRLVEIDRRRFEFMVSETPFFALAVMRVMADRLRKTNTKIA